MNYRLFIDDERFPVTPDWFVARTSGQAIKAVKMYGLPQEIAFDLDQDFNSLDIKTTSRAAKILRENGFIVKTYKED